MQPGYSRKNPSTDTAGYSRSAQPVKSHARNSNKIIVIGKAPEKLLPFPASFSKYQNASTPTKPMETMALHCPDCCSA